MKNFLKRVLEHRLTAAAVWAWLAFDVGGGGYLAFVAGLLGAWGGWSFPSPLERIRGVRADGSLGSWFVCASPVVAGWLAVTVVKIVHVAAFLPVLSLTLQCLIAFCAMHCWAVLKDVTNRNAVSRSLSR